MNPIKNSKNEQYFHKKRALLKAAHPDEAKKLKEENGKPARLPRAETVAINVAGIAYYIRIRRHRYGALLVEAGEDIAVVSKALRHSGIKITSDQYIAGTHFIKKKATATFDNIVNLSAIREEKEAKKSSN